jgi:hypothetical protein
MELATAKGRGFGVRAVDGTSHKHLRETTPLQRGLSFVGKNPVVVRMIAKPQLLSALLAFAEDVVEVRK